MTNVGMRPAILSRWVTSVQLPGISYDVTRQQGCPGFCSTEPHICWFDNMGRMISNQLRQEMGTPLLQGPNVAPPITAVSQDESVGRNVETQIRDIWRQVAVEQQRTAEVVQPKSLSHTRTRSRRYDGSPTGAVTYRTAGDLSSSSEDEVTGWMGRQPNPMERPDRMRWSPASDDGVSDEIWG
jgi:hypothetical protein